MDLVRDILPWANLLLVPVCTYAVSLERRVTKMQTQLDFLVSSFMSHTRR
jgi:hypothetical protein